MFCAVLAMANIGIVTNRSFTTTETNTNAEAPLGSPDTDGEAEMQRAAKSSPPAIRHTSLGLVCVHAGQYGSTDQRRSYKDINEYECRSSNQIPRKRRRTRNAASCKIQSTCEDPREFSVTVLEEYECTDPTAAL